MNMSQIHRRRCSCDICANSLSKSHTLVANEELATLERDAARFRFLLSHNRFSLDQSPLKSAFVTMRFVSEEEAISMIDGAMAPL
jgi:hypothetical protein